MSGRIVREKNDVATRLGMPEAGRLHIGEKRVSPKTGKEYPVSLDYFKADGNYPTLFHKGVGEKPNIIQVIFPSDDASLVCNERYELRDSAGKMYAEGDGETFKVWDAQEQTRKIYEASKIPNLMERLSAKTGTQWKVCLTMRFLVPAVRGVWGYWQLTTSGESSSIPQVRDTFDAFLEAHGKVQGVIFDLAVKKVKSGKPGDSSTFPVLTLIPNESMENVEKVQGWLKPVALIEK